MGLARLFKTPRGMLTGGGMGLALVLAAVPINRSINVPAILLPQQEAWVYAPEAAEVVEVLARPGDRVSKGQVLVRLSAPGIAQEIRLANIRLQINRERLARVAADGRERAQAMVLQQEQQALVQELGGLEARAHALAIRAPQGGVVSGMEVPLAKGRWVGQTDVLYHLAAREAAVITGLVADRFALRLRQGAKVRFISEDGGRAPVAGILEEIGAPGAEGTALMYLSSTHGGPIATAVSPESHQLQALTGFLPLRFRAEGRAPEIALRGTATVDVAPESLFAQAFGRFATVVLRESGF